MKKNFKTYALITLIAIAAIFILDYFDTTQLVSGLQDEKKSLIEKASHLEKQNQQSLTRTEQLQNENKQLKEQISRLEEEIEGLKSFINYQDLKDAISTVNSYKSAKTFQETISYIALVNGTGISTVNGKGACPCWYTFNGHDFKWEPNVVQNLMEYRSENGKIILIFNSVQKEQTTYQFVMTKALGYKQDDSKLKGIGADLDGEEKWRIEEIKQL